MVPLKLEPVDRTLACGAVDPDPGHALEPVNRLLVQIRVSSEVPAVEKSWRM